MTLKYRDSAPLSRLSYLAYLFIAWSYSQDARDYSLTLIHWFLCALCSFGFRKKTKSNLLSNEKYARKDPKTKSRMLWNQKVHPHIAVYLIPHLVQSQTSAKDDTDDSTDIP